ncbi:TOMM precursor leader peptide-binding protein [Streptomyces syringium]|uniref:TOMM precursor leader peptide-binding protein n=1 Tax=Streptomyces syringium TaxID=76729 RepID=UPI003457160B
MSEAYEAIARTRPRIRRDVLFTETPDGVLFHNAHGGFHLNSPSAYRFATLVVPHLSGENRVEDICRGLGEKQRAMVARLVTTLYERKFARDAPAPDEAATALAPEVGRRFAAQLAYVDHYVDDAPRRFERFRDTRVAVLGDDLVARWCVLALVRNGCASIDVLPGADTEENRFEDVRAEASALAAEGCPVEIGVLGDGDADGTLGWADLAAYDAVVVTGGPAGSRRLLRLLTAGVPEGTYLLPASMFGSQAVVGPLMASGTTGCWACAVLRLGANGDAGTAAELWSGLALPTAGAPVGELPGRSLSAMIGNLLGYEIFRIATGALPAETRGQVIVQDTDSFDVVAEPLLPHPRCPFCAAHDEAPEDLALEALPGPGQAPVTVEVDPDTLLAELNGRQALVRPHTGVFHRFTDEPWTQTPLKVGSVSLSVGHTARRQIAAFDIHTVAGARLRALDAAAAVYTEHVAPLKGVRATEDVTAAELEHAPDPAAYSVAGGLPAGPGQVTHWVPATSLLTKERVLVPAGAVRTFGPYNRHRLYVSTSAGTGAGPTAAAAAGRGLLSALAHDALGHAVRGSGQVTRVAAETVGDDAELVFLLASARNLGIGIELLDLGERARSSAHVLLCRAADPRGGAGLWAVAGELGWRDAAAAAVRDLLGRAQFERELPEGESADTGDPLLGDLAPETLAVTGESAARGAEGTSYPAVLARLRAAGRDALAVPTGPADLAAGGITTARVLLASGAARA